MSCNHMRQRRLPCAAPGCDDTNDATEIKAEVINGKGIRRGLSYQSRDIPEQYKAQITWTRASWPLLGGADPDPVSRLLGISSPSVYFWAPILEGKAQVYTRGLDSWIALYCPSCSNYLGKTLLYRKGVSYLVGCSDCDRKYRPKYVKEGKLVEWRAADNEHLGSNNAISVVEYPDENYS